MRRARQVALLARPALARVKQACAGRRGVTRARGRELETVEAVSGALSGAADAESVARVLLDETARLLDVEFAALTLVEEDGHEARGLLARRDGADFPYWHGLRFDLEHEPSGVASAVFDAAPIMVFDVAKSTLVNPAVAHAVGARSAAFVPLLSDGRVLAVLSVATTAERRAFRIDELGPLRALVAEATLALERARSAEALADAVERERLVAQIGRRVRSELDLHALQRIAVEETGRALGVQRCFIRLDRPNGEVVSAEWYEEGLAPVGDSVRLPASNLAARRRETVAIADVERDPQLDDPATAGAREILLLLGTRAVLATPIVFFDRPLGVFALHHTAPHNWTDSDVALAEAVARELGLAIHTASLLRENELRLGQQAALLRAAKVVTSELRLETVLPLLVDEVRRLLDADAADCSLYDSTREVLRCVAVHGLDRDVVGLEFEPSSDVTGRAIAEGRTVIADGEAERGTPAPRQAFEGFARAIAAPMIWSGETRGVIAARSRDSERAFDESDAELLAGFASLASLALRNAEAFELRERQAQIERGFSRVVAALSESLSLEQTLDAVAQAAADVLGGSFGAVLMPGAHGLELAGSYRLPPELGSLREGLPPGAEVLAEAAADEFMLTSSVLEEDERFGEEARELAAQAGCRAVLAMPLAAPRAGEGGLVLVCFAASRQFSDDEVELARQLASAARGALERSELFEAERRARALSQRLTSIGSRLGARLEPATVLHEVAKEAVELLNADCASVRVLEDDALAVAAAAGNGAAERVGSRLPAGTEPATEVMVGGAPLALADASTDSRLVAGDPFLADNVGYLGAPLANVEGTLNGVLAVYSRKRRVWRAEEIEALGALALTAAATYASAELYQRVALERERSLAILANVADGIVAVDASGRILQWNAAAEQITGVPSVEALGRTLRQVLHTDLSDASAHLGERHVVIRRGSDDVHLSLTEAVMRDSAGDVSGRVLAFRDISREHLIEQMKSDFVSTVSHELRAPLTSIYGFAETLLRPDIEFSEDERNVFLGYVASEASRLATIVDQLLNVAQLDTGDLEIALAPTDVRPIVSEVVANAERATDAEHRFAVEVPEEPLSAQADEQKLRQILVNLVDNAIKFSPNGGLVTVAAQRTGDVIALSVVDEGIGIPAAERDRIFAKFYRLPRGAVTGGTGLGLSIAQGLVSAMGGQIKVESAEGQGSTFVVELPAAPVLALQRNGEGVIR